MRTLCDAVGGNFHNFYNAVRYLPCIITHCVITVNRNAVSIVLVPPSADNWGMFADSDTPLDQLEALIRTRRAVRRYSDRPVPPALLARLLEAAQWAPSAHNRQPWRFAVVTQAADKTRLAAAMGERLRADRAADGDPPDAIARDVARSHARISAAPVLIIIALSMVDMDRYPDARRSAAEQTMAVQGVAMAAHNLWLLAHAAGLGACWLCAPLFVPQLVQATLNLPADWEPQGMLTLGWPAETKEKTRRVWTDQVRFI